MKLYIIGNGFDRHFNLKTSTDDFKAILKDKKIYNELYDALDIFEGYGINWSNFEMDLGDFDFAALEERQLQYPDYSSEHEYDRDGGISNMEKYLNSLYNTLFSSLKDMVCNANHTEINESFHFESDNIICFNYTNTIERVADQYPKRILYIHGSYDQNDELIFGYKDQTSRYDFDYYSSEDEYDIYMNSQLQRMKSFYCMIKKCLQIEKISEYLNQLEQIDVVVVYGHAVGSVDVPYYELIEEKLSPKEWRISYYDDNDDVKKNVLSLSFYEKIKLFEWNDEHKG